MEINELIAGIEAADASTLKEYKRLAKQLGCAWQFIQLVKSGFKPTFTFQEIRKANATCDCCGLAIADAAIFNDSIGAQFKAGLDCSTKIFLPNLETARFESAETAYKREQAQLARAKRLAKEAEQLAFFEAAIARGEYNDQPHPKGWASKTLNDYLSWLMPRSGHTGKMKLYKEHFKN